MERITFDKGVLSDILYQTKRFQRLINYVTSTYGYFFYDRLLNMMRKKLLRYPFSWILHSEELKEKDLN